MQEINQAAAIAAPVAVADATGKRGVMRVVASTSNTSTALPTITGGDSRVRTAWGGHFVRIQSIGCDTQVAFSTTARTLVINQASAIGTGSNVAGWSVVSGTYQDFIVPADATHINFISSAAGATCFVEFYMSELIETPKSSL